MVEVSRHQVGGSEQIGLALPRLEAVEPAVLQEAAEHGAHADRLADAGESGDERADGADDEVDLGAGLRCAVELLDNVGVGEVVDLDPDPGGLARLRGRGDGANLLDELAAQAERGGEDLAEALRPSEAGHEV